MVDIRSATAENRLGKKEERKRKIVTTAVKYRMSASATQGGHNIRRTVITLEEIIKSG